MGYSSMLMLMQWVNAVCPTVRTVAVLGSCTVLPTPEGHTVRTAASDGPYVRYSMNSITFRSSGRLAQLIRFRLNIPNIGLAITVGTLLRIRQKYAIFM